MRLTLDEVTKISRDRAGVRRRDRSDQRRVDRRWHGPRRAADDYRGMPPGTVYFDGKCHARRRGDGRRTEGADTGGARRSYPNRRPQPRQHLTSQRLFSSQISCAPCRGRGRQQRENDRMLSRLRHAARHRRQGRGRRTVAERTRNQVSNADSTSAGLVPDPADA
jgi:hypothetical protein